ncbi:hypothetical protein CTER_1391 [Ruminiclostridium cellobioparum subsp. termitidis CT1112]|uniref:Uncharacterized protein n=1 Tax=Ruminiclostridium cellobioparum subsp. termitidis CT1112 TaxID=1195236 RepID=S0FLJ6_RUMCE|nr:hypothetical protein CTER_1391 [Ruminiclostridium cellobioparum subsp. termitidis CT1112]
MTCGDAADFPNHINFIDTSLIVETITLMTNCDQNSK